MKRYIILGPGQPTRGQYYIDGRGNLAVCCDEYGPNEGYMVLVECENELLNEALALLVKRRREVMVDHLVGGLKDITTLPADRVPAAADEFIVQAQVKREAFLEAVRLLEVTRDST